MPFRITPKDAAGLGKAEFEDFVGELLKCEARRVGMPLEAVIGPCGLTVDVPDGGVDGLTGTPPPGSSERLPDSGSVWQCKTGSLRKRDIATELRKPGVAPRMQGGMWWCLALSTTPAAGRHEELVELAKEHCRVNGCPENVRILSGAMLADWANAFPAIALWPFPGRPRPTGLLTFDEWSSLQEHGYPFVPDERREAAIGQIRGWIDGDRVAYSVRIEGAAGVGKTRLALEALRGTGWEQRTVYCQGTEMGPALDALHATRTRADSSLALVVDECEYRLAEELRQHAEGAGNRVRLVTIGTDATSLGASLLPPGVVAVGKLEDGAMRRLLNEGDFALQPGAVAYVVHMTEGYVKLAVHLARAITDAGDQARSTVELAETCGVPRIVEALIPEDRRRVMESISLLTRLGVARGLQDEGEAVAQFMGVSLHDIRDARHGKVAPFVGVQERYRSVTPRLLAVWLARGVWEAQGDEMLRLLAVLPTPESQRSFLRRCSCAGCLTLARRRMRPSLRLRCLGQVAPSRSSRSPTSAPPTSWRCSSR